ncbi:hypothetical protein M2271_007841 [Streptomyces sp. LBL]|nr:hypothetical protein [Streptomyces sp. LBL]MDH6629991.1 hypothetical protein [Streptomyces sp. LBL]
MDRIQVPAYTGAGHPRTRTARVLADRAYSSGEIGAWFGVFG